MHFCERIYRKPARELKVDLDDRFGRRFTVRYQKHLLKECLFVQRDDYKLMRFYEPELTLEASNFKDRLFDRVAGRMASENWDNYT